MNTLISLLRIAIPVLIMHLAGCKKEEGQPLRTGEELLRISKVERIDQSFEGHPFYNYPGAVVYKYDRNSNLKGIDIKCYAQLGINCDFIIENTIVYYSVESSNNQYTFTMSDRTRSYNYFYLDTLRVTLSDGFVFNAEQRWAPRRQPPISIALGDFTTVTNLVSSSTMLREGALTKNSYYRVDSDEILPFPSESFSSLNKVEEYIHNNKFTIRRQFTNPDLALSYFGFGEHDLLESYELVEASPDLPPALVRMVNNALLTFVPLGLETPPNAVTREIGGFLFVGAFPAPFNQAIFQDWIFKLGMLDLDMLKSDGNYIISSKKVTGRKVIGATGTWPDTLVPVYQDVDSTTTFPYTHDPIAKTLEIAGLKIWYEVVD